MSFSSLMARLPMLNGKQVESTFTPLTDFHHDSCLLPPHTSHFTYHINSPTTRQHYIHSLTPHYFLPPSQHPTYPPQRPTQRPHSNRLLRRKRQHVLCRTNRRHPKHSVRQCHPSRMESVAVGTIRRCYAVRSGDVCVEGVGRTRTASYG